jgi:hypothetical protein
MNLQVPTPTAVINPSRWEDLEDKIYMRFSRGKVIVKITALWGVMAYIIADTHERFDVQYWFCLRTLNFISDLSIHNTWAVCPPQLLYVSARLHGISQVI